MMIKMNISYEKRNLIDKRMNNCIIYGEKINNKIKFMKEFLLNEKKLKKTNEKNYNTKRKFCNEKQ